MERTYELILLYIEVKVQILTIQFKNVKTMIFSVEIKQ